MLEGDRIQEIAASQSNVPLALDGAGKIGDFLSHIAIIPQSTSPGAVTVQDGSGTTYHPFAGGASSVSDLSPRTVVFKAISRSGAWKVTTGANVIVEASGAF